MRGRCAALPAAYELTTPPADRERGRKRKREQNKKQSTNSNKEKQ